LDELDKKGLYQDEIISWDMHFLFPALALHDLGKLLVRESILYKKEPLTEAEFEEIKKHPSYGIRLIDQISPENREHSFLGYARISIETHHERWDGTGYPKGLKETEIPLLGRLIALADMYDSLISPRPYRKGFSTEDAKQIILKEKGLDPVLIGIFKEAAPRFAEIANGKNRSP
jgi:putative two-component system response regulator